MDCLYFLSPLKIGATMIDFKKIVSSTGQFQEIQTNKISSFTNLDIKANTIKFNNLVSIYTEPSEYLQIGSNYFFAAGAAIQSLQATSIETNNLETLSCTVGTMTATNSDIGTINMQNEKDPSLCAIQFSKGAKISSPKTNELHISNCAAVKIANGTVKADDFLGKFDGLTNDYVSLTAKIQNIQNEVENLTFKGRRALYANLTVNGTVYEGPNNKGMHVGYAAQHGPLVYGYFYSGDELRIIHGWTNDDEITDITNIRQPTLDDNGTLFPYNRNTVKVKWQGTHGTKTIELVKENNGLDFITEPGTLKTSNKKINSQRAYFYFNAKDKNLYEFNTTEYKGDVTLYGTLKEAVSDTMYLEEVESSGEYISYDVHGLVYMIADTGYSFSNHRASVAFLDKDTRFLSEGPNTNENTGDCCYLTRSLWGNIYTLDGHGGDLASLDSKYHMIVDIAFQTPDFGNKSWSQHYFINFDGNLCIALYIRSLRIHMTTALTEEGGVDKVTECFKNWLSTNPVLMQLKDYEIYDANRRLW